MTAARCTHDVRPAYELALYGEDHLLAATYDAATWADRIHQRAQALAAATTTPQEATP